MVYDTSVDFSDSASKPLLDDITYASPIGFRLLIDAQRYPNAQFSIQTASIPEMSVDVATFSTPQGGIEIEGDKIKFSPFSCTFLVDEQLENYYELYEWLVGLVVESDGPGVRKTRDISLMVLNSHNNVSREIQFTNAYPTSLSTLDFDAKNTNLEYLVGEVTFNYSYFKVK